MTPDGTPPRRWPARWRPTGRTLGAPLTAIWRVDVAPCHATELHARRPYGGWRVTRTDAPVAAAVPA